MTYAPYVIAAWLFVVGLFGVVISRNLIRTVVAVVVAQSSTYVLLLAVGYKKHATAPIFADIPRSRRAVDPVVQALALTDIVVTVTAAALFLALALNAHLRSGSLDPERIAEMHG
jgi:multicomponent Na+:H+ antiporter subunit C